MKRNPFRFRPSLFVALATLVPALTPLFGQGPLTPPGAPAPTMHSLGEIYNRTETRIPITNTSSTVTIAQPGSYYLTGNLTVSSGDGVDILASGVTLDLNGFTIAGVGASGLSTNGIYVSAADEDIVIANGHVRGGVINSSNIYSGPGFYYGISSGGVNINNVTVSKVTVSGCLTYGISLGSSDSTLVESCVARTVGGTGIAAATVRNCVASDCGGVALTGDVVADSTGYSTGGTGVTAGNAQNCIGASTSDAQGSDGINAGVVEGCQAYAYGALGVGISAAVAHNSFGYSGGSGNGLTVTTADNCVGVSTYAMGIMGNDLSNCKGTSTSGPGVSAYTAANTQGQSQGNVGFSVVSTATGCYGVSSTGPGLEADNGSLSTCRGTSGTTYGIYAKIAENCIGTSTSGTGLYVLELATGCYGRSDGAGYGIYAATGAMNCAGTTVSGPAGIAAGYLASSSCAVNLGTTGVALNAYLATGCAEVGATSFIPYKYNMP